MVAWFALTVAPRKEKITAQTLRQAGLEEFLPLYSTRRKWSDRIKKLENPLFPGYVFCRFEARIRTAVMKTPGVVSVVSFGRNPEPVDEAEIEALQAVCRSGLAATPWPMPKVGSKVLLREGPLKGLEGIFVEDKKTRLVLSLTLLQRAVAVEIDREWISPVRGMVVRFEGQPTG
ncbi:MAG TPA: UpxY family transcription antiterminator [Bryobacteraceae bacterium]|jgi:transcription antitermination factor NusG|nr:UpxY family transcription antiterminator [Bryobacteraceae bacterium]